MSTTSENLITLNKQGTLSYGAAVMSSELDLMFTVFLNSKMPSSV